MKNYTHRFVLVAALLGLFMGCKLMNAPAGTAPDTTSSASATPGHPANATPPSDAPPGTPTNYGGFLGTVSTLIGLATGNPELTLVAATLGKLIGEKFGVFTVTQPTPQPAGLVTGSASNPQQGMTAKPV